MPRKRRTGKKRDEIPTIIARIVAGEVIDPAAVTDEEHDALVDNVYFDRPSALTKDQQRAVARVFHAVCRHEDDHREPPPVMRDLLDHPQEVHPHQVDRLGLEFSNLFTGNWYGARFTAAEVRRIRSARDALISR